MLEGKNWFLTPIEKIKTAVQFSRVKSSYCNTDEKDHTENCMSFYCFIENSKYKLCRMGRYKIVCKMSLIFRLLHFKSVQTTINVNVSIKYIRINMHLVEVQACQPITGLKRVLTLS